MRFGSVCSGIEAASTAWHPLGWKAAFFSEIEPFPCALLAHRYDDVPNHGDMTNFKDWPDHAIDLLCGGAPCQSFSNAGLRAGLDDPRGQLMLTFGAIAARYRPRWLVWENVPGVLSSNGGRDFGAFLGLLGFLGYGFAYRVLDAQFVRVDGYGRAVPQRRNRVFVVGCLGDWRSAAAVLLERESLRGDSAPRRSSGSRITACLDAGPDIGGDGSRVSRLVTHDDTVAASLTSAMGRRGGQPDGGDTRGHLLAYGGNNTRGPVSVSSALSAHGGSGRMDFESETFIAFDTTQITSASNYSNPKAGDPCHPLAAGAHAPAIAFDARQSDVIQYGEKTGPIDTCGFTMGVHQAAAVRRLTPRECERLMGFPDDYTAIPWRGKPAADGPRYKALGNSWAVNCARWIGWRIAQVDAISAERAGAADAA
jgi:DNA (cytosine-5)-methyltransferase 1